MFILRHCENKFRTFAHIAFHSDTATMKLYEVFNYRQANTVAITLFLATFRTEEALEYGVAQI